MRRSIETHAGLDDELMLRCGPLIHMDQFDEAAWAALCSTTSYPFDPPQTGMVAVKAINRYSNEVLRVIDVAS